MNTKKVHRKEAANSVVYNALTCMRPHMNYELTRLDETFLANGALMRPFSRVRTYMSLKFPAVLKSASAMRATVRFLVGVDTTMDVQILLGLERFVTHFALEKTCSCKE